MPSASLSGTLTHPAVTLGLMTRSQRHDPIDGWHHVMSRGVNRQPIFYTDEDRLQFGALLAEISNRFGIEIHCYCLMTNHFHLLVRCPMGQLSTAIHLLLSVFARYVNDHVGRVGHLFGDRFCSRLVTEVVYLANTARYIHLNPLDIVGVENAAEYRWSSHRTYVGLRPAPEWLLSSGAPSACSERRQQLERYGWSLTLAVTVSGCRWGRIRARRGRCTTGGGG